jgi:RNA polymerase sigma-70 factor (ECF subfamily)
MTRNRAVDRVRSKDYREQTRQVDLAAVQLFAEHPSANPQASAILGEEGRIVASALRSLHGDQQQVLALAYYEGYSQSEISELLRIPLGTVKSRMRKALVELRSMLRERL